MDLNLSEWFANRQRRRENQQPKQPLTTEEYCALWKACFQCRELLYMRDLRSNLEVCPKCQYHFRIGAEERIEYLCDQGTFVELDENLHSADPLSFFDTDSYPNRQAEATKRSGLKEAIVTGVCKVKGQTIALAVMDFDHFGGSMGSAVGEKVTRTIEHAIKFSLPLVVISSSGGARMQEGILSLMQMAKTSSALSSLKDARLLYISILTEPTFGGVTASFAMLGDVIIAERGARVGFAGRRVIEDTIRQKLPADFQTAEYLLKHGHVDMVIDRPDIPDVIARLAEFHNKQPGSSNDVAFGAEELVPSRSR
jgi:acetyl-CoA carboxylase carboxyl transferase subunit beta